MEEEKSFLPWPPPRFKMQKTGRNNSCSEAYILPTVLRAWKNSRNGICLMNKGSIASEWTQDTKYYCVDSWRS